METPATDLFDECLSAPARASVLYDRSLELEEERRSSANAPLRQSFDEARQASAERGRVLTVSRHGRLAQAVVADSTTTKSPAMIAVRAESTTGREARSWEWSLSRIHRASEPRE